MSKVDSICPNLSGSRTVMRTMRGSSQKQEFASQAHTMIFRDVEEATRREQEKNGSSSGSAAADS
jgi:hypothetical protein